MFRGSLGHIFEQSIADIEEIRKSFYPDEAPLSKDDTKQHKDGIFYTPPFVTQHIVQQTIGRWIAAQKEKLGFQKAPNLTESDLASIKVVNRGKKQSQIVYNETVREHIRLWEQYKLILSNIKVLDPSCGSGAFLNEAFDFLLNEGNNINSNLDLLYGGQSSLFRWDTHILANNLYGVDINRESIEITKLSLWLKTANRREKLTHLEGNIKPGNSLINDPHVANDLAFDWKSNFCDIINSGGFDIIIGNPPYVDSELMAKARPKEREYIANKFKHTRGNWDLYIAFIELGCDLLAENGYLSFITPDKWISKDFGFEIRKRIFDGLISILPVGRGVFETALVDSIITTIGKNFTNSINVMSLINNQARIANIIDKSTLIPGDSLDKILSKNLNLLTKIDSSKTFALKTIAIAENACATSDTYKLSEFIINLRSSCEYNNETHYKIANTGTLSPYCYLWGIKPMKYLKRDFIYPIVARVDFLSNFGETYKRRAQSPKLIIKGLTLLHAAIDINGSFIPGKSTIVICSLSLDDLKFLLGIINSKFASFYIKQKYSSASYNGGVNFTPEMINSFPIAFSIDKKEIINRVDKVIHHTARINDCTFDLYKLLRSSTQSKIGKKFEKWHELSDHDFISELKRNGIRVNLSQRREWIDYLSKVRQKTKNDFDSIIKNKLEIDKIIFTNFNLSSEEIDVIEHNH